MMRLISARIVGFQSFNDSGVVTFVDGINLIVGQNNAGKSALLRALQPSLVDDRHRTAERWETFRLAEPVIHLKLRVSGREFEEGLLRAGSTFFPMLPVENAVPRFQELSAQSEIEFSVLHHPGYAFNKMYPGHRQFVMPENAQQNCLLIQSNNGELTFGVQHGRGDDSSGPLLHNMWSNTMFYFSAERMTIGESGPAHAQRLSPSANNLPAVLLTLAGDRGAVFGRLVNHLRQIFPTVGNLSVRPKADGGYVEVRVWPTKDMERVELSFPLNSSGTGVSQVIAILTAVMTVENAVIIIDEINSFLHPAAVKALLRILQTEYAQHQYIISTHAPEVIGFSNPRRIHLVKRDGYESTVEQLSLEEVAEFRRVAEHLGVSMADVFAADRVIWVEGPTEELCFPLLYQQATSQPLPRGTIFTSVVATGDFISKKRDRQLVYEIYRQLGCATTPLVVAVAFSFDSEALSEVERQDMGRESRGTVHFLPRRHIECYLIDSTAIAAFIVEKDQASVGVVTPELVAARLIELAGERSFLIDEWRGNLDDEAWAAKVDAANLIACITAELSEQRATFNKKDDTLNLMRRVQEAAPAQLAPLCAYVRRLVESVDSSCSTTVVGS
jgi:predicted ATPase